MNIALLTGTFFSFSGIDRVVEQQAKELALAGHAVTVFCFDGNLQSPSFAVRRLGYPQSSLAQRLLRLFYGIAPGIIRRHAALLRQFDLLYAHQYPLTALAAWARRKYGVRFVYYDHGVPPPDVFPSRSERLYTKLFRWLWLRSIRNADEVITISLFLQNELRRHGIVSYVRYDQADVRRFHLRLDGARIRERLGIGKRPMALFVGRISPHKKIEVLINAFRTVANATNAFLVIVGKPTFASYMQSLRRIADERVIFVGAVTDEELPEFYAACTVYVTASEWEGFDLPVAEAHACGKSVIMSDMGPHPEIRLSGDALFPPGNVQRLAELLRMKCSES